MSIFRPFFFLIAFLSLGCGVSHSKPSTIAAKAPPEGMSAAIFAGGCFWCMEKPFDVLDGVQSTTSGYIGGKIKGPSYKMVANHRTQHIEALRVVYDPQKISYDRLLEVFWRNIDPTQSDGQFCDRGHQYTSAIFYGSDAEKSKAEASREKIKKQLNTEIHTDVRKATEFWIAEEYHQDFYKKNYGHYIRYRTGCGRDKRLKEIWGTSSK